MSWLKPVITKRSLVCLALFICGVLLAFGLFSKELVGKVRLLSVHFINIGYGDCILLQLPDNNNVLIDSGTEESLSSLQGYLDDLGIRTLKAAILTHPHKNHFGGFSGLLDTLTIQKFYYNGDERAPEENYYPMMEKIRAMRVPAEVLRRGDTLKLADGVEVLILHPQDYDESTNSRSLVTWVAYKNTAFLLTADIEEKQQGEIMEHYPFIHKADCIQVPHHGGSVSEEFGRFFGDKIFVVSSGENDGPRPEQKELDKLTGTVLRTDIHGTIVLLSDGKQIKVRHE